MRHTRISGFTLVELSIVLVIIGLIVGGVFAGKSLIEAAKIRKQVADLQQFISAVHAFETKYDLLPGDVSDRSATRFGLTPVVGGGSGSENGEIDDLQGNSPPTRMMAEPTAFFVNLTDANLITGYHYYDGGWNLYLLGPGTQAGMVVPPLKLNPKAGIAASSWNGSVWFFLGISDPGNDYEGTFLHLSTHGVLTPSQAYQLDQKMDDGLPGSGSVVAIIPNSLTGALDTLDTTDKQCVLNPPMIYNVTDSNQWCRLYVKVQ